MLFSSYNSFKKSQSQSQSHLSLFKPNGSSSFHSNNSQFKRVGAMVSDSNTPTRRQVEVVYNPEERINKLADEVDKEAPLSRLSLFSPCIALSSSFEAFRFHLPSRSDMGGVGGDSLWHKSGSGLYKQNSVYDFVACADYLVNEGNVHRDRVGAIGFIAGCLVVGAAINMYPDLLRAAILKVRP